MVIFNELMARIAGRFGRIEPRDDGGIMACDDQFRLLQGVERVTVDLSVVEDFCTTFTTHNDMQKSQPRRKTAQHTETVCCYLPRNVMS
ncbi:hypothetical protein SAMN05216275_102213 [Streptosporangium canum]|uniref:Uncharacterized protein n=2 Tax=Streptosporangium canum TaxID=324952 RepID=A0A1I3GT73_9ACTN|nr:hypothetical protein SAMN05216275_102213 [Streptosporangium canum]